MQTAKNPSEVTLQPAEEEFALRNRTPECFWKYILLPRCSAGIQPGPGDRLNSYR